MSKVTVTIEADVSERDLREFVQNTLRPGGHQSGDALLAITAVTFLVPRKSLFRSAKSGRFVTAEFAARHTRTTVHEAGDE